MAELAVGDRAPQVIGATIGGRFYSLEIQAGRPAALLALGALDVEGAAALLRDLAPAAARLEAEGVDLVALARPDPGLAAALAGDAGLAERIVFTVDAGGLDATGADGRAGLVLIDRGGRILALASVATPGELLAACEGVRARLASEPGRVRVSAAPALILPNVVTPQMCAALIAQFEASPHRVGAMASIKDGQAYAKIDEAKKHRREIELEPGAPLHEEVVRVLAERCAPEIKRAFQVDIAHADRILLARYDDTGGYFKRHRDDAAPNTRFREFAISINLNTHEYEGGELIFPEFGDDRYSPPAGGAIIFSASLLHEAAPVTRGQRHVLLSFLCSARAQAWMAQAG